MKYRIQRQGDRIEVMLEGILNFASNDEFQSMLVEAVAARARETVLNLSGIDSIDSVGLGLLYIAQEDIEGAGSKLILSSPRDAALRLLELTEAAQSFTIVGA